MHHHPFCHHHPHRHNTRVIKQKTPQKAPTSIIFFMVSPLIYSSSPPQALNPPKFLRLPCSHPYLQRFFTIGVGRLSSTLNNTSGSCRCQMPSYSLSLSTSILIIKKWKVSTAELSGFFTFMWNSTHLLVSILLLFPLFNFIALSWPLSLWFLCYASSL